MSDDWNTPPPDHRTYMKRLAHYAREKGQLHSQCYISPEQLAYVRHHGHFMPSYHNALWSEYGPYVSLANRLFGSDDEGHIEACLMEELRIGIEQVESMQLVIKVAVLREIKEGGTGLIAYRTDERDLFAYEMQRDGAEPTAIIEQIAANSAWKPIDTPQDLRLVAASYATRFSLPILPMRSGDTAEEESKPRPSGVTSPTAALRRPSWARPGDEPIVTSQAKIARAISSSEHSAGLLDRLQEEGMIFFEWSRGPTPEPKPGSGSKGGGHSKGKARVWFLDQDEHKRVKEAVRS